LRDGHQRQRTPAHAQEVAVKGVAVRKRVELRSDGFAEVEQLRDERVERAAGANSAREESERSSLEVFANVLQIVAELQQNTPGEGEFGLLRGEAAATHQVCIGKDRCSSLGAGDAQQFVVFNGLRGAHLLHAVALCSMDSQQRGIDLRIQRPRELPLDEGNELPQRSFPVIRWRNQLAAQPTPEALREGTLLLARDALLVEEIVAVGIDEAVAENRRREAQARTQQRLETAGRPRIARGLHDARLAQVWIEAARPLCQLNTNRKKTAGEQIDGLGAEVHRFCGKASEGGDEPVPGARGIRRRGVLQVPLDGAQCPVVGRLAAALGACREARSTMRPFAGRAAPVVHAALHLRQHPGRAAE